LLWYIIYFRDGVRCSRPSVTLAVALLFTALFLSYCMLFCFIFVLLLMSDVDVYSDGIFVSLINMAIY